METKRDENLNLKWSLTQYNRKFKKMYQYMYITARVTISDSTAPQIWNHIPTAIRVSPSLDSFKRHLKTHYFASP